MASTKSRIAIFDYCRTLVTGDTLWGFLGYLKERGHVDFTTRSKPDAIRSLKGLTREQLTEEGLEYYRTVIRPKLSPEVVDRMKEHAKEGLKIVVVSASLEPVVRPFTDELELECKLVTNQLKFDENGKCTGELTGPDCHAVGKIIRLKEEIDLNGIDLKGSFSYADNITDIPVLCLTGRRVVVKHPGTRDDWSHLFDCESWIPEEA